MFLRCKGVEDLTNRLHDVVASGGEGLIIRAPSSGYKKGRAHSLLRVKVKIKYMYILCLFFVDVQ